MSTRKGLYARSTLLFFAVIISIYALGYFWITSDSTIPLTVKLRSMNSLFVYCHLIGGGIALLTGILQLWTRHPSNWHRVLGYSYCISVFISGIGGCFMAFHSELGWITGAGFLCLDILWLGATGYGLSEAIRGEINSHRRWMLRSLACTCAAISLRIYLPLLMLFFSFSTSYIIVAWLCWIGNLALCEAYLRRNPQFKMRALINLRGALTS